MLLGVDAGGSTCRARLVKADGSVLGTGLAGPANTRLGAADVILSLKSCCLQALVNAQLTENVLPEVDLCVGIAGHSRSGVVRELETDIFFRSFKSSLFVSDADIAHAGAHGEDDGGTVIVGTGSVAIATLADSRIQIGGKGFPGSDLGSGAHIGLLAVQHALLVKDGVQPASALSEEILAQADGGEFDLCHYFDQLGPTEYAQRAPLVVRHADSGDDAAVRIMARCAQHVDEMLLHLRRLGVSKLCLVGGLGPTMEQWVTDENRRQLVDPQGDPINGAVAIAAGLPRSGGDLQAMAISSDDTTDDHAQTHQ